MDKSIARHLGLTPRQLRSGNYRVNFRDGNETTAYYTDNLEDASMPRLRWPVSEHFQLQSARSRSPRDDCRLCHTVLAATNKCLAQSNKSRTGPRPTKKRNRQ